MLRLLIQGAGLGFPLVLVPTATYTGAWVGSGCASVRAVYHITMSILHTCTVKPAM